MNEDWEVGVALSWSHKIVLMALPDKTQLLWMFTNRYGGGVGWKRISVMAAYQMPADN